MTANVRVDSASAHCWVKGCIRQAISGSLPLRFTPEITIVVALCSQHEHLLRRYARQEVFEELPPEREAAAPKSAPKPKASGRSYIIGERGWSVRRHVEAILRSTTRPLTVEQLEERLLERDVVCSTDNLRVSLMRLEKDMHRIRRVARATYQHVEPEIAA